jgi:hypothetical protein
MKLVVRKIAIQSQICTPNQDFLTILCFQSSAKAMTVYMCLNGVIAIASNEEPYTSSTNRDGAALFSPTRMKPFFALAVLIFPAVAGSASAGCQQVPSLGVLLDRLDAYAKHYQATLPSLECDEQITSQALNKKGRVTWEVKIQSTLREIRTAHPYDPFLEKREYKSIDGHRPKRNFETPYFAEGGFAGLVGFKRWEQRECFDYFVSPENGAQTVRLEMTLKANFTDPSCAKLPLGLHRIVIADPETGRVLHTERTIEPDVMVRDKDVYFGEIDYAPQKLGEQTFWLPSRFYAHDDKDTGRMVATYSNCHRYTGELKILPDLSLPGTGLKPH